MNLFSGVRDAASINQLQLNNRMGGYITPVRGAPPGQYLPRNWLKLGEQVRLDLRQLKASQEGLHFMKGWIK